MSMHLESVKHRLIKVWHGSWTIGSSVALVNSNEEILLCRRFPERDWRLPGGLCRRSVSQRRISVAAAEQFRRKTGLAIHLTSDPVILLDERFNHLHFLWRQETKSRIDLGLPKVRRLRPARWHPLGALTEPLSPGTARLLAALNFDVRHAVLPRGDK